MRPALIIILALLSLTGCETPRWLRKTIKVDNPVVGPPPPRVEPQQFAQRDRGDDQDQVDQEGILQTRASQGNVADEVDELNGNQVVATVDGEPIFAAEFLNRNRRRLLAAKKQLTPKRYEQERNALIHEGLEFRIEQLVLVHAMEAKLSKEQIEGIYSQLDAQFEQFVEQLKKSTRSSTTIELEHKLAAEGESLGNLQRNFVNKILATEYLRAESNAKREFSRDDLFNYYMAHRDEYHIPAQVRWQKLVVRHKKHGGKAGAFKVLEKAVTELRGGADFSEVARRYSDDITAEDGGLWQGWMPAGTLSDKRLEASLFKLPVGEISKVFENNKDYTLVRVIDRKEERYIPFPEKQNEIEAKLRSESQQNATRSVIERLVGQAAVEVYIPKPEQRPRGGLLR